MMLRMEVKMKRMLPSMLKLRCLSFAGVAAGMFVLAAAPGYPKQNSSGAENLHLEDTIRFQPIQPGADAERGREAFGVAADLATEDPTDAVFEGDSITFGGPVVSNGRTCFTCHRGEPHGFGLPAPPLSPVVPLTDTLFTGIEADAQGDPDALHNLDQLGLIKYRINRFNPTRSSDDPFRRVFAWRKSPKLLNIGLTHSFLTDGRGRVMFETARGAVFAHTQASDNRFDDLFNILNIADDMEAFQFGIFSQPELAALRDSSDPLYDALVNDPFLTVDIQTAEQRKGARVFRKQCMGCHDMPNVFNNRANVEPTGNGDRPVQAPAFAPSVGRAFNIGISERNLHGLRFTEPVGGGQFEPIILPLVAEDGTVVDLEVQIDVGLAATTGRLADVGHFKVPQLRGLAQNAPYFHDNSAETIEEVVDYFNGPGYNTSKDGKRFPVRLTTKKRSALITFLKIL